MADRLLYGSCDAAFAPYDEYWRQACRVCALHLLSARRVRSFHRVREQEAGVGGTALDLSELLTGYTPTPWCSGPRSATSAPTACSAAATRAASRS
jgi:hypothetical protein